MKASDPNQLIVSELLVGMLVRDIIVIKMDWSNEGVKALLIKV